MTNQPQTTLWVRVCALNEIPLNKAKGFTVNGQMLAIARCAEEAVITQGICSHMFFPLGGSKVEDCTLTCGLHRSKFDLHDGSVQEWSVFPPIVGAALAAIKKSKALRVYPSKIENGEVFIQWPGNDPATIKVKF
jgi:nitrite reductase/ring-hydroxylating ferredoxin subunit